MKELKDIIIEKLHISKNTSFDMIDVDDESIYPKKGKRRIHPTTGKEMSWFTTWKKLYLKGPLTYDEFIELCFKVKNPNEKSRPDDYKKMFDSLIHKWEEEHLIEYDKTNKVYKALTPDKWTY